LPATALVAVDHDHRLADSESLEMMLGRWRGNFVVDQA
jgi:hypothetical protein